MSEYDPNSHDAVLSRILTDIQAIRATQIENREKLDHALERVSALEQFRSSIVGMAAVVSAGVGFVVAILRSFFDNHPK